MAIKIPTTVSGDKKSRSLSNEDILPIDKKDKMTYPQRSSIPVERLGFNGGEFPDCTPTYIPIRRAKVIKKYDSYIVLGGDAPNGPGSGYSSFGARCSSIDMVVGRLSANVEASTNPNIYCYDNYDLDAARIHISQRTDVDENFAIKAGNVGNAKSRSAIVAKADGVRIIGREGIKLVTSPYGKYNSQSGKISTRYGIDLMAGNNETDLQPIVKGDNLVFFLENIMEHIRIIYSTLFSISKASAEFAVNIAAHTHVSATGPIPPSVELTPSAVQLSREMIQEGALSSMSERLQLELQSIESLISLGAKSINSENNRVN